jgi:hypothetical protein
MEPPRELYHLARNAGVAGRSVDRPAAEQLAQDSVTAPHDLPGQDKRITKGGMGKIVFRSAFSERPG